MNNTLGRFLRPTLLLALGLSSVGCTPYATFPSDGGVEFLAPGMYPAPQLMGKGLRVTYEKTAGDLPQRPVMVDGDADGLPPLVYALPEGVSTSDWRQVGIQTEVDSAREATRDDLSNGISIWEVKQLRIRSNRAEVDVVYPSGDDLYQLATVIFKSEPFGPFKFQSFQRWLTPEAAPTCSHPVEVANAKAEADAAEAAEAARQAAEEKAAADADAAKKAAENEASPASDLPGDGSAASAETDAETAAAE
ncbi:MAG: hypothetical protein QMB94_03860 [Phycisphaerales bacterium]